MASVRQIAKLAGVSITTVSRVLNNHPSVSSGVRENVLALANRSRYMPLVSRRSTSNIAFASTGPTSLGSEFDAAILDGVGRGLEEAGFDLMILDMRRRLTGETYSQMFMRKGIRGVLLRTDNETRHVCEAIAEEKFPSLVIADRFENPLVNYIYCDSRETSREAVEYLLGLGHRQIAICLNVIDDSDHTDRLAGFQQAYQEAGLELDRRFIMRVPANRSGGAQVMRRIMTMSDRPTAVFITDPGTAAGAMREARNLNVRIPEELSLIGFDDTELRSEILPEMTAVCQDASRLGYEAFTSLCQMIDLDYGTQPIRKSLRTWLEIHSSTAAPMAL